MRDRAGWAYGSDNEDAEFDDWDSLVSSDEPRNWVSDLSYLREYPLDRDSKLDALRRRLRTARDNGSKQVLIFSFFRKTVEYLAQSLSPEFSTALLHGGIPMADREDIIAAFRSNEFDILISNQVGSEGLDFEFCNVLVNYDLPWNPMQVEQRIGRLDRFGQVHEKIFIFNLHVPGTIESDIIGRLYARIGVFENSIGDLEAIMRNTMQDVERLLDPRLSTADREAELDRIGVAIERNHADVKQLEESSGVLTTTSLLDVDGLTDNGPSSGRYIGHEELKRLLSALLTTFHCTLVSGHRTDLYVVHGNDDLARALRSVRQSDGGTMIGVGKLAGQLRDGLPITIAFKPDALQNERVELVTARHPLIRLAVTELGQNEARLQRFGRLRLPSLPPGSRFLARIDLARTSGVRPLCEMWITTVDLATMLPAPHVEDLILVALAEGAMTASGISQPSELTSALAILDAQLQNRQTLARLVRNQDNAALVDARLQSMLHSNQIKVDRAQEQLRTRLFAESPTDEKILRMMKGRLKNLSHAAEEIRAKYENKRQLTLSVEQKAIAFITG